MRNYRDWKGWQANDFGRWHPYDGSYFRRETRITKENAPELTILELGFGNGQFLGWCRSIGVQHLYGVELDNYLIAQATKLGVETFPSLVDVPSKKMGTFDLIVAFDVLEHIPGQELKKVFEEVASLLRPGGTFLARFPNGDSPFGRILQHGDETHVTSIGRGKICFLGEMVGLQVAQIRRPAQPLFQFQSPARFVHAWCTLIPRMVIEGVLRAVFHPSVSVPYSLNYTAVLRKGIK